MVKKSTAEFPPPGDAPKSLADRVYDQQSELNRIESALRLARVALSSTDWEGDATLSALHSSMFEIAERLSAVTDTLDGIHLKLAAAGRETSHAAH